MGEKANKPKTLRGEQCAPYVQQMQSLHEEEVEEQKGEPDLQRKDGWNDDKWIVRVLITATKLIQKATVNSFAGMSCFDVTNCRYSATFCTRLFVKIFTFVKLHRILQTAGLLVQQSIRLASAWTAINQLVRHITHFLLPFKCRLKAKRTRYRPLFTFNKSFKTASS